MWKYKGLIWHDEGCWIFQHICEPKKTSLENSWRIPTGLHFVSVTQKLQLKWFMMHSKVCFFQCWPSLLKKDEDKEDPAAGKEKGEGGDEQVRPQHEPSPARRIGQRSFQAPGQGHHPPTADVPQLQAEAEPSGPDRPSCTLPKQTCLWFVWIFFSWVCSPLSGSCEREIGFISLRFNCKGGA